MLQRKQPISISRVILTVVAVIIAVVWLLFFFPVLEGDSTPTVDDADNTAQSIENDDVAEKPVDE